MKRLFIEPLDVLMFRSERPFVARESHVAKFGVISPLTFEGALKSKIFLDFCEKKGYLLSDFQRRKKGYETKEEFEKSLEELREAVKDKLRNDNELKELLETIGYSPLNYPSKLNILGVFFSKKEKEQEWFPVPKDAVRKDDENGDIVNLDPILKDELKITGTEEYVCFSNYSKVKEISGLLSFDALVDYLWGKKPDKSQIVKNPYDIELRTGIQLERGTKRTIEGHLYTAQFLRLKNWKESWGFIIWYESLVEISNGIIRLGGEGKGTICGNIKEINLNEKLKLSNLIKEINKERKFKLYIATPSYFNGYKPPKKELEKCLGLEKLELMAALPGNPVYIGGYDFAMNKEKPLQRWVNAGAVYYYKFEGNIRNDLSLPIKMMGGNIDMRCAFIGRW